MSSLPKISIVTPSFNQGKYLEDTITSILGQNYPNLEYVIIDGGSQDQSVDIINKYQDRLHYWCSEKDDGHADAINKGFAHTTGEIMAWLNSDDKYTPWAFETVARIFSQFPHVQWIVGVSAWWNSAGAMTGAARGTKNRYDYYLGRYAWIQQESVFWRRSLWDKVGGKLNQDYRLMIDGELWSRFFQHTELYAVDCILGGFRSHTENRGSQHAERCVSEMDQIISNYRLQCPPEVQENGRKLQYLQKFRRGKIGRSLVTRLGPKILPQVYQAASYPNLTWRNEQWVEERLPYVV